jgi:hypothetical protein
MLLGNDVLDVKGSKRYRCLWQAAVFTSLTGAATNLFSNGSVHQFAVRLARTVRARD